MTSLDMMERSLDSKLIKYDTTTLKSVILNIQIEVKMLQHSHSLIMSETPCYEKLNCSTKKIH